VKVQSLHSWAVTPTEAVALQRELACRIDTQKPLGAYELVAGADISYSRYSSTLYAGVVVLRARDLALVESQAVVREATFPYVPGLLSFREAPAVLEALRCLHHEPDVVVLDGQGTAHPRRLGLACHVGLWLDRPTIGCAKSLLTGKCKSLGEGAGALAPLVDREETVGMAVRTKRRVRPVYVSAGHRIDLASAIRVVLSSCRGYRLPEPTRQAHLLVNAVRRQAAC
jgi:deoxyribonuclease V